MSICSPWQFHFTLVTLIYVTPLISSNIKGLLNLDKKKDPPKCRFKCFQHRYLTLRSAWLMLVQKVMLKAFVRREEHRTLVTSEPNFRDDVSVELVGVVHNKTNNIRAEFALKLFTAEFRPWFSCWQKWFWVKQFAFWVHDPKIFNFLKVIPAVKYWIKKFQNKKIHVRHTKGKWMKNKSTFFVIKSQRV